MNTQKVGVISCGGEMLAEGTISRLATRRVLELLRPNATVTLCLPLFLAGNEGERNFAKTHPTITVDGCDKQCAKWGTEQHSGPVSSALVVTEILGTKAAGCQRSSRRLSDPDRDAVWLVAERIAAEVDAVTGSPPDAARAAVSSANAGCSCSGGVGSLSLLVGVNRIVIPGLPLIFAQCVDRDIPADETGSAMLLDAVKVYHRITPEEQAAYRVALLTAYEAFRNGKAGS